MKLQNNSKTQSIFFVFRVWVLIHLYVFKYINNILRIENKLKDKSRRKAWCLWWRHIVAFIWFHMQKGIKRFKCPSCPHFLKLGGSKCQLPMQQPRSTGNFLSYILQWLKNNDKNYHLKFKIEFARCTIEYYCMSCRFCNARFLHTLVLENSSREDHTKSWRSHQSWISFANIIMIFLVIY